ncbi:MAG: UDP-glucose/iron transport system ATP-binding protein [Actinomycetota bacterium]|jgi:putative ABC transport system ATP-binding protein|nr:UDP-glucose/iron transport system ATP-binding protein [Actinomycetota bacterium]
MQAVLALDDVRVVRDAVTVLDGITAQIAPGRCTALAGPSGAGKTTLLRLLDRLEEPTTGTVLLHGRPLPSYDVLEVRRRVGLVQQVPVLLGTTVLEDLRVGRPALTEDEAVELLSRVGLRDQALTRATASLSGGEAQRLCLGRALAVGPEVLLLDEPTSALDAVAAKAVERVVRALVEEGLTAVLVSHDLRQARRLADDVVVLRAGRVEEVGPAADSVYLAGAS